MQKMYDFFAKSYKKKRAKTITMIGVSNHGGYQNGAYES